MSKSEYLKLVDSIAAEIADGTLRPGDRLPPQRNFAWERKIAVSTASRVYAELLRRGLVVGEVGRGTFISGEAKRGVAAPGEPRGVQIDFEFNYPMLPDQTALIAKSLAGLEQPAVLDAALRQSTSVGTPAVRSVPSSRASPPDSVFHWCRSQWMKAACGQTPCKRRTVRRIFRRSTSSR